MWEEPPPRSRGGKVKAAVELALVQLKERPGEWARILTFTGKTTSGGMRKQLAAQYPDCEFRAGRFEEGSALWARYVEAGD